MKRAAAHSTQRTAPSPSDRTTQPSTTTAGTAAAAAAGSAINRTRFRPKIRHVPLFFAVVLVKRATTYTRIHVARVLALKISIIRIQRCINSNPNPHLQARCTAVSRRTSTNLSYITSIQHRFFNDQIERLFSVGKVWLSPPAPAHPTEHLSNPTQALHCTAYTRYY